MSPSFIFGTSSHFPGGNTATEVRREVFAEELFGASDGCVTAVFASGGEVDVVCSEAKAVSIQSWAMRV